MVPFFNIMGSHAAWQLLSLISNTKALLKSFMPDEKIAIVIKAFQVVYRLEKYFYFLLLCYIKHQC